ncbi:hypothetical protein NJT12_00195 [Flavobacterium sp. AC]|uniref:Uncharacterized protein n=1 Tax=Flavobacterium azizsancarii TaxID=2961580 RepID=A0ABT4W623_9FLAO|nr:hypothetical protein [Flavobacterium azizsancarii]MDA6068022.1 hypothetical protein [Flavobacterium azizsancarii]
MKNFNKIKAFDELMNTIKVPENSPLSSTIKKLIEGQEYLQKIHDDAYRAGFDKGCDATKKVDEL